LNIRNLLLEHYNPNQLGKDIDGNLYEALVGAIFLDKGYLGARRFIYKSMIDSYIDLEKLDKKINSYKSYVIEWAQKQHVDYNFKAENSSNKGYRHYYKVNLFLDNKKVSYGRSSSKKKAEEIAARRAYYTLKEIPK